MVDVNKKANRILYSPITSIYFFREMRQVNSAVPSGLNPHNIIIAKPYTCGDMI